MKPKIGSDHMKLFSCWPDSKTIGSLAETGGLSQDTGVGGLDTCHNSCRNRVHVCYDIHNSRWHWESEWDAQQLS